MALGWQEGAAAGQNKVPTREQQEGSELLLNAPPPERTFADKMLELYARLAYVQKGGENKHFKYRFLQESELKARLNLACRELGLLLSSVSFEYQGDGKACVAKCHVCISDVLVGPGHGFVMLEGLGGGVDSGDKAPMKACVSAFKYAIMNGCMIQTGDDPEEDASTDGDAAEELALALAGVPSVTQLQALKVRVALFKGGPAFDELKAAYKRAQERLAKQEE